MGLPWHIKHKLRQLPQQMMCKTCVSWGRTRALTPCHGTLLSPASGMPWPRSPSAGRVVVLGTAGCKGHCCPLLVQGQRGQPGLHPRSLLCLAAICALNAPVLSPAAITSAACELFDPRHLLVLPVSGPFCFFIKAFSCSHHYGLGLQRHSDELGDRSHVGNISERGSSSAKGQGGMGFLNSISSGQI